MFIYKEQRGGERSTEKIKGCMTEMEERVLSGKV